MSRLRLVPQIVTNVAIGPIAQAHADGAALRATVLSLRRREPLLRNGFEAGGSEAGQGLGAQPPRFDRSALRDNAWFMALCALGALLVVAAAIRYRLAQVRIRFEAVLAERARLARELHDALGQGLAGVGLQLDAAAAKLESEPGVALQCLEGARRMLDYSREETRRTLLELRSEALERADLVAALRDLVNEFAGCSEVAIEMRVAGNPKRIEGAVEHDLLRIAQEALTNALRHSGARTITLTIEFSREAVSLAVADDGRGLAHAEPRPASFGIRGMHERARRIAATLAITSEPGRGLELRVRCPLARRAPRGADRPPLAATPRAGGRSAI